MNNGNDPIERYFQKQENKHLPDDNEIVTQDNISKVALDKDLSINTTIQTDKGGIGILGKFQMQKVQINANIAKSKVIIDAKLEIIKQMVAAGKDLKSKEIELTYKQAMKEMEIEYTNMLDTIGLKNKDEKFKTMKKLMIQTDKQILEATSLDIHQRFKDQLIEKIFKEHKKLSDEISKELGDDIKNMGKQN